MRTVNSGMHQEMADPAFEGIEGESLIFSNQKIDLGLKSAHTLMYERCHEIPLFSHVGNECLMGKTTRQI